MPPFFGVAECQASSSLWISGVVHQVNPRLKPGGKEETLWRARSPRHSPPLSTILNAFTELKKAMCFINFWMWGDTPHTPRFIFYLFFLIIQEHRGHREIMEKDPFTGKIIGSAIEVHRFLGPGLLESPYQQCLARELHLKGLKYKFSVSSVLSVV